MLTITRTLNVYASGIPQIINLSQYDDDFQIVFNLYTSDGTFTAPSGTTAEVMGTKTDGNGYSATASISGSSVTVTGNKQMTACAGRNIYEIVLTYSNKRLATINFILQVERAALDADTIQSETVLKELNAIIDSAAAATQAAEDAQASADAAAESALTLTIDPTLTQSGQAADAKVTGDEIADIKEDLSDVFNAVETGFIEATIDEWQAKTIDSNGNVVSATNRICTVKATNYGNAEVTISFPEGYKIWGYRYSNPEMKYANFKGRDSNWTTGSPYVFKASKDTYYGFIYAKADDTVTNIADADNIDIMLATLLHVLDADVTGIKEQLPGGTIPEYYFDNDYLQNKAKTAQLASNVNGVSFGFITDIHTGDSSRNSMKLAKYIADRTTALPFMIFGGDVPETNTGTLDGLYEQAQYWQEMMAQYGKHNVYQCRGNHDYLANLSSGSVSLANGACYSYVMGNRPYDIIPSAKGKPSYYFDVPSAKVRFIVLDEYDVSNTDPDANFTSYVGLSPVQYHWLVDDALKVDGYDVVIVAHQPLNLVDDPSYNSNLNLLRDLITAYNAHQQFSGSWGATTINVDFSTYTSNLICVLSGHKHVDASGDTGFLNIVTTSDALYTSDGYGRQMGTITECAFDIVSIDTHNKVIKCTRIGAGNDRTFNY